MIAKKGDSNKTQTKIKLHDRDMPSYLIFDFQIYKKKIAAKL